MEARFVPLVSDAHGGSVLTVRGEIHFCGKITHLGDDFHGSTSLSLPHQRRG
jgi:hypothetical protein